LCFESLFTDASKIGLGAVLKQKQSNGKLHPIGYFSKKLLPIKTIILLVKLNASQSLNQLICGITIFMAVNLLFIPTTIVSNGSNLLKNQIQDYLIGH